MNREVQSTESWDEDFADLDAASPEAALAALLASQRAALSAVETALPAIAGAAKAAAAHLADHGRLVYVGAGTSGRIAAQDGAELGPTFGWPEERLLLLPAGGPESLIRSVENAEDDRAAAVEAVERYAIAAADVVIGVAASGTTPYTVSFVASATKAGALTIGLANNPGTPLLALAHHPLLIATGAEPIAGSTRLKAGTAQKVVLNLFSTVLMMLLNRVYRGRMVDLEAKSAKLRRRAIGIVRELSGASVEEAERLLDAAEGNVKYALLLAQDLTLAEAKLLLGRHRGSLRRALAELPRR